MTSDEAVELANHYISQKVGPSPQLMGERCEYQLTGAHRDANGMWVVSYQIHFPGPPPSLMDGPVLVLVDPITRNTGFFDDQFR